MIASLHWEPLHWSWTGKSYAIRILPPKFEKLSQHYTRKEQKWRLFGLQDMTVLWGMKLLMHYPHKQKSYFLLTSYLCGETSCFNHVSLQLWYEAEADPAGDALGALAPPPEPSMKIFSTHIFLFFCYFFRQRYLFTFWGVLSSSRDWKLHTVTPLPIPQSYYQFDTSGAKTIHFEDQYNQ